MRGYLYGTVGVKYARPTHTGLDFFILLYAPYMLIYHQLLQVVTDNATAKRLLAC